MAEVFIVCDENQTYVPLANLGVGNFNYDNYTKDRNYKYTGPFIGRHLGTYSLRILCRKEIPNHYKEWVVTENLVPKPIEASFREFFKDSEYPLGVFCQVFKVDQIAQFAAYEYTKVEPLLVGSIRFDGTANWHFPYSYYPLHFTNKKQAEQFGLLFSKLYEWVEEIKLSNA